MRGRKVNKSQAKNAHKRKEEEEEEKWSMSNLPHDITIDILSRLPLKTLYQSKLVSRTWSSLLSDPLLSTTTKRAQTFLLQTLDDHSKSNLYLVELRPNHEAIFIKFNTKCNIPSNRIHLVGSHDGLLCLFNRDSKRSYFLCNPITGEYLVSTPRRHTDNTVGKLFQALHGFSHCKRTMTYNVLRFTETEVLDRERNVVGYSSSCEVHRFGSNKWCKFGGIPFPSSKDVGVLGVTVNDLFHWAVDEYYHYDFGLICALDTQDGKVRQVLAPPEIGGDTKSFGLGVLGGCLSIISDNPCGNKLHIWVMKSYGLFDSWTKEFVIPQAPIERVVGIKGGEIGVICGMPFTNMYNPRNKESWSIKGNNKCGIGGLIRKAVSYEVSYDSLKSIFRDELVKNIYTREI